MLTLVLEPIEHYARSHTTSESFPLRRLSIESFGKTKSSCFPIGHLEGALLRLLVKLMSAKRVLEIGTFTGYSALAMAEGLPDDGKLITLDKDWQNIQSAKEYWSRSPHGIKIKSVIGNALDTIKTLDDIFDFVFIDADKTDYINYWDKCMPKVRGGGCIVVDNVLWRGRVLNPMDENSQALDSFNKYVLSDKRVEAVMLTVRDGLTIAYKK